MVDLILTQPTDGPATLFTRNFRVHSGIPIGLYREGPRAPVALVYGNISSEVLESVAENYPGIIAVPSMPNDEIPETPCHYEYMTVKAPILATMQTVISKGFNNHINTFEGGALVYSGKTRESMTFLFTADLIKATIRILSGQMESCSGFDHHGRHHPPPESVTNAPGVSLHFNLIENLIRYLYRKLELPLLSLPRWPSSAPFAVFLSHDVDVVKKWTFKRSVYELLRNFLRMFKFEGRSFFETVYSISESMKGRDPYWLFDELLFMESGNGFNSTWFFAPFGKEYKKRQNPIDPVYHRKDSQIAAMIKHIMENDCEIALHGIRNSYISARELKKQLGTFENRLGFKLLGERHHYLMFRQGETLDAAAEAGLTYDSSLGFTDKPGFRNGMAAPFFANPLEAKAGRVVEIPLVFMDSAFLHTKETPEGLMRKITEAYLYSKVAGGLFSILIHPGYIMDSAEIPELKHFYHSLISRFRMEKACSMTGAELAQWWMKREQVLRMLEFGPKAWRIQGVEIPKNLDISISAPNIKNMRFSIDGASGSSTVSNDTLKISPGMTDSENGITIYIK